MKHKSGRCMIWLLALVLSALLSGCMMSASVEDLYSLPQLPVEYQALSAQIESILSSGAEYTAPTSAPICSPCSWWTWTETAWRRLWPFSATPMTSVP